MCVVQWIDCYDSASSWSRTKGCCFKCGEGGQKIAVLCVCASQFMCDSPSFSLEV